MVTKIKKKPLLFGIAVLFSGFLFGQSPDAVTIKPKIAGKQLVAECRFKNLISPEMMEGLSSGISRSFVFRFTLLQDNVKELISVNRTIHFKYNVWEDFYIVNIAGKTHTLKSSAEFNRFLSDSLHFNMTSVSVLPKDKSLHLQMVMSSDDLASSQKEKLNKWLRQSEPGDNSISEQDDHSGFSINLSGLLSLFFGTEKDKNIKMYLSEIFTLQSLK